MTDDHFLHAYRLHADGTAAPLSRSDLDRLPPAANGYFWIHMCALNAATRSYLERSTDLKRLVIDAMLAKDTRPRALIRDDGALVILRAMNLNAGADPEDMISIRIRTDHAKLITTRRRDIKAIEDIVGAIREQAAPKNPCEFLTLITDRLFERMEPFLIDLEDSISKRRPGSWRVNTRRYPSTRPW